MTTKLEGLLDDPKWGALERHLREAMSINTKRMPIYAEMSGGRSLPYSRQLIRNERLAAFLSRPVDWYARRYQRAGVPIVVDDYVSMHLAPDLRPMRPDEIPSLEALRRPNAAAVVRDLKVAYRRGGFAALRPVLQAEIDRVHAPAAFLCMYRHLLESMRRIAYLAPKHDALAREKGVGSTLGFSWFLLRSHFSLLVRSVDFDLAVAPLQAEGVPFLYLDLPPISEE